VSGTETVSSAKATLCCGEAGEKEKVGTRGTMGRKNREERRLFPSSHRPPREIPSGSLCGGERY